MARVLLVLALLAHLALSSSTPTGEQGTPADNRRGVIIKLLQRMTNLLEKEVEEENEKREVSPGNAAVSFRSYSTREEAELRKRGGAYVVSAKLGNITVYPQLNMIADAECRVAKNCHFSVHVMDDSLSEGEMLLDVDMMYDGKNGITMENLDITHKYSIETCRTDHPHTVIDEDRCNCYHCEVASSECPPFLTPMGYPSCNCVHDMKYKKGKNQCRLGLPAVTNPEASESASQSKENAPLSALKQDQEDGVYNSLITNKRAANKAGNGENPIHKKMFPIFRIGLPKNGKNTK